MSDGSAEVPVWKIRIGSIMSGEVAALMQGALGTMLEGTQHRSNSSMEAAAGEYTKFLMRFAQLLEVLDFVEWVALHRLMTAHIKESAADGDDAENDEASTSPLALAIGRTASDSSKDFMRCPLMELVARVSEALGILEKARLVKAGFGDAVARVERRRPPMRRRFRACRPRRSEIARLQSETRSASLLEVSCEFTFPRAARRRCLESPPPLTDATWTDAIR